MVAHVLWGPRSKIHRVTEGPWGSPIPRSDYRMQWGKGRVTSLEAVVGIRHQAGSLCTSGKWADGSPLPEQARALVSRTMALPRPRHLPEGFATSSQLFLGACFVGDLPAPGFTNKEQMQRKLAPRSQSQ
jgi:hypothetical protein